ncbi:MAG: hypothetical protein AB3N11_03465 [Arenibacterium sp.]
MPDTLLKIMYAAARGTLGKLPHRRDRPLLRPWAHPENFRLPMERLLPIGVTGLEARDMIDNLGTRKSPTAVILDDMILDCRAFGQLETRPNEADT